MPLRLLVAVFAFCLPGCDLDGKTCTLIAITTTAQVRVLDGATKQPICDATVRIGSGPTTGASTQVQAMPIAATADAPCSYRGGSFGEGSVGTTITYYVERAGYQSALATGRVPATADGCHVGTPTQTIELSK